jgi:hypothetical protein
MSNAQRQDNELSNLRVRHNLVIGDRLVAGNVTVRDSLTVPLLTTAEINTGVINSAEISAQFISAGSLDTGNFQLTQAPQADFNILTSDDMGNGSWTVPADIPGLVTGSGTTGRIASWLDGPNSELGDTELSISSVVSAVGSTIVSTLVQLITAPAANLVIISGPTVVALFGTSAAPDVTVPNGNLVISSGHKGLVHLESGIAVQGPSSNSDPVSVAGISGLGTTSGKITMFDVVTSMNSDSFSVTNPAVLSADSLVLLTVMGQSSVSQIATTVSLSAVAPGSFSVNVSNLDPSNDTDAKPVISYLVINVNTVV